MEELQESLLAFLNKERNAFNKFCSTYEAWQVLINLFSALNIQISLGSILLFIFISAVYDLLFQEKPIFQRIKLSTFRFLRKIPMFRAFVKGKLEKPLQVIATWRNSLLGTGA